MDTFTTKMCNYRLSELGNILKYLNTLFIHKEYKEYVHKRITGSRKDVKYIFDTFKHIFLFE